MTGRAPDRMSLLWRRDDRVALTVLLGAWCIWLGWAAAGRSQAIGATLRVHPGKIDLVREKIDPNTATADSLRRLPLIGPEKANAIVEHRKAPGRAGRRAFEYLEDLANVPGIGPGILRRAGKYTSLPSCAGEVPPTRPQPATTGP